MAKLNRTSERITKPRSQGASQAMLFATGLREFAVFPFVRGTKITTWCAGARRTPRHAT